MNARQIAIETLTDAAEIRRAEARDAKTDDDAAALNEAAAYLEGLADGLRATVTTTEAGS